MSHIGINITFNEFRLLESGMINTISRPKTKYWKEKLLEPRLDKKANLIWIPRSDESSLKVYATDKSKKHISAEYEIKEIKDKGKMVCVRIVNLCESAEDITIEVFGEKYSSPEEILKGNKVSQIKSLLELMDAIN